MKFYIVLAVTLLRFGPRLMAGDLFSGPDFFSRLADIEVVEAGFLVLLLAMTSGKRMLRRGMKLGLVLFALNRVLNPAGVWFQGKTLTWESMDGPGVAFGSTLLGRLVVVLEQLPSLFAGLPGAVDVFLSSSTPVPSGVRSEINMRLLQLGGLIPWRRILFFLMDLGGIMAFFRFTKMALSMTRWVPSLNTPKRLIKAVKERSYNLIKDIPIIRKEVEKEQAKLEADLDQELKARSRAIVMPKGATGKRASVSVDIPSPFSEEKARSAKDAQDSDPNGGTVQINRELPKKGTHTVDILTLMRNETQRENMIWEEGKVSGAVYHGGNDHQHLLNSAFGYYSLSNPLHPDIWPSGMKFESEVIAMTASLMYGGKSIEGTEICGCTTSGGTESIILAIKAARDFYRDKKGVGNRRRGKPEVLACISAHAAVDKACDLMGLKLVQIPYDDSPNCANPYQMDVAKTKAAITENTILIYSSAPSFAHGVIDPIAELGQLALRYDVALHVDCCLGGFILPFARDEYKLASSSVQAKREAGSSVESMEADVEKARAVEVPAFDFTVPGVTSMSVDTHKFGYTLKGTSVALYKEKKMRQAQYFCYPQWSGGMYTTPTIAGSRSGGLISQCWASLMSIGYDGYRDNAVSILKTTKDLAKEVAAIPGVRLLGNSMAMIVCFASDDSTINTYSLADQMTKRGWSLNTLQNPPCVHLCVTMRHIGRTAGFVTDLKDALADCRAAVRRGDKQSGKAAIYGMASGMPTGPVEELLKCYNDVVLKT